MGAEVFSLQKREERKLGEATNTATLKSRALVFLADSVSTQPQSDEERAQIAEYAKVSEIYRQRAVDHARACMEALSLPPNEALSRGAELASIPTVQHIPIGKVAFRNEQEMQAFLGKERSDEIMEELARSRIDLEPIHLEWHRRISNDTRAIVSARLDGAEAGKILSTDDLRKALAVQDAHLKLKKIVPQARQAVADIIGNLNRRSSTGVKSGPFLEAIDELGRLSEQAATYFEEISRSAHMIAGHTEQPLLNEGGFNNSLGLARAVFHPLTQGSFAITRGQLHSLQRMANTALCYQGDVGTFIRAGHQKIGFLRNTHQEEAARQIEEALDLGRRDQAFRNHVRGIQTGLDLHELVIRCQAFLGGALLEHVPEDALEEARRESGLPPAIEDQEHLVLRGDND